MLGFAVLTALGGAGLLYAAHRPVALVVLGAVGIFAAALKLFDSMIELKPWPPVVSRSGRSRGCLASLDVTAVGRGRQPAWMAGECRKPQINRLICKPICKPDAAILFETGDGADGARWALSCPPRSPRRERLPETSETHVVWLITQRRLETSRRASTWLQRNATADRKSASGALREACSFTAYALAAPIARIIALAAPKMLKFSGTPFHEPFHGRGAADY